MISDAQKTTFEQDGFVILDQILDATEVERVREAMERAYAGEGTHDRRPEPEKTPAQDFSDAENIKHLVHARFLDSDMWDLVTMPRLGEIAAGLLDAHSVALTEDQLLEKPAGGKAVAMHQDYAYWSFSTSPRMATMWIALVDTTLDMGPICFLPGSQEWGLGQRPDHFGDSDEERMFQVVHAVKPDNASLETTKVVVPAGGGSVHHSLTFHGSSANTSARSRASISLHFAAPDCTWSDSSNMGGWPKFMWAGLNTGDRITNEFMPLVYRA